MLAAILILITLSQLMLTPSASILTEVISDVTLLKNELNSFMTQDGNTTEMSASGEFVRPPKVVNTKIIKNKLHELQNDVTKLAEAILNKTQNVDDIKNRISTIEKQIEDLSKLYDDKDREITQTLEKFQKKLSDLLAKYNNAQYEEFLEAIKNRYYQLAAVKLAAMKDETSAINWIQRVYDEIGDLPPMLELADHVNHMEMKVLIYETIVHSYSFQHCLNCNVLLTCNKLWKLLASNVFTGNLKERFTSTYSFFYSEIVRKNHVGFCWRPSVKKNPEFVKNLVERHCLSRKQRGSKPEIQDYSGYCYPVDSIYNNFQ